MALILTTNNDGFIFVEGAENWPLCSQNFPKFNGTYNEENKAWIFPPDMIFHIRNYVAKINDSLDEKRIIQHPVNQYSVSNVESSNQPINNSDHELKYETNQQDQITKTKKSSKTKILKFKKYSEKSVAVFGREDPYATKQYKKHLYELGGKFNAHLKYRDESRPGWIFSSKKADKVKKLVKAINVGTIKPL
jgi:hypothetical protein